MRWSLLNVRSFMPNIFFLFFANFFPVLWGSSCTSLNIRIFIDQSSGIIIVFIHTHTHKKRCIVYLAICRKKNTWNRERVVPPLAVPSSNMEKDEDDSGVGQRRRAKFFAGCQGRAKQNKHTSTPISIDIPTVVMHTLIVLLFNYNSYFILRSSHIFPPRLKFAVPLLNALNDWELS